MSVYAHRGCAAEPGIVLCSSMLIAFAVFCLSLYSNTLQADVDLPTKFTNIGGITNTRHNLTQLPIGAGYATMNSYRNQYGEVCVYCHTPHGANTKIALPLWNRTFKSTSYTTYNNVSATTLKQQATDPGLNSLACLSCHDGTLAIDSIINMPGSGGYMEAQELNQDSTFLTDNWTNPTGSSPNVGSHMGLNAAECLACHSPPDGGPFDFLKGGATDFTQFALGTDLTNDHPIGVGIPAALEGIDFNSPVTNATTVAFFDLDGDTRADTNEIRLYDTGQGYEVECASCHDPSWSAFGRCWERYLCFFPAQAKL